MDHLWNTDNRSHDYLMFLDKFPHLGIFHLIWFKTNIFVCSINEYWWKFTPKWIKPKMILWIIEYIWIYIEYFYCEYICKYLYVQSIDTCTDIAIPVWDPILLGWFGYIVRVHSQKANSDTWRPISEIFSRMLFLQWIFFKRTTHWWAL